ncbi:6-phosphofructokinase, partial [Collinsella aerofaciens]|nr:6-phosphofructokinase [Collinsella aerofaciens]
MGRHAGWLTAASILARKFEGDNPVLIYVPEVAFDQEAFIAKVTESLKHTPNLVVCISEGIHDKDGTFICEYSSEVGTD